MANKGLWTPEGFVSTAEKDVIPLTRKQLILLADLHEFAHQNQLTIVCKRCDSAIQGQNNDSTKEPSVQCQCRQWRYVR